MIRRNWLFFLAVLICLLICCAAVVYSQEKIEYGPQAVFVVDKALGNSTFRIVPRKALITFRISPSPETHPAPLPEGTNMLCRTHDVHATNGATYLGLRCGLDEYIVEAVGVNPEK